jgi:hypothetical protein
MLPHFFKLKDHIHSEAIRKIHEHISFYLLCNWTHYSTCKLNEINEFVVQKTSMSSKEFSDSDQALISCII